jgi:hypothetical protein
VATVADGTAEREDCLDVEREGGVPTAHRVLRPPELRVLVVRTKSKRQDALRQDIVPPLPGASKKPIRCPSGYAAIHPISSSRKDLSAFSEKKHQGYSRDRKKKSNKYAQAVTTSG